MYLQTMNIKIYYAIFIIILCLPEISGTITMLLK
jgi:hypothetical protein